MELESFGGGDPIVGRRRLKDCAEANLVATEW